MAWGSEEKLLEQRRAVVRKLGRNARERGIALRRLAESLGYNIAALAQGLDERPEPSHVRYLFRVAAETTANDRQQPQGSRDNWAYWCDELGSWPVLVEVVDGLGLGWCDPDNDPFLVNTNPEWLERIQGTGSILSRYLRSPSHAKSRFSHPELEVILIVEAKHAIAWVGRHGFGIAVGIDRSTLEPRGRVESPGFRTAAGLAIAWYVDVALAKGPGVPMMTALALGKWIDAQYRPSSGFDKQISAVSGGMEPAFAHWVVSHVRTLNVQSPDPGHVAEAPSYLRARMGPDDTWVRGHIRQGSNVNKLLKHLAQHPALADAVGTAFWKP